MRKSALSGAFSVMFACGKGCAGFARVKFACGK